MTNFEEIKRKIANMNIDELMNQAVEYSGIEMAVNRQGMLRVRVLDDDGSFTTQDIIEIRNCPLCGKRFMKGRCV